MRGNGFDADAGFTIVEVVVASTLLLVAFLAAAGLFEAGTRVSGDTRQRVIAAQLASSAIEKVRGPAADPARFTTSVVPGQTVTTQTVNGLKFTITQEMQWVGQSSTTSACDSGGVGSNSILQVSESVTWPGAGATAPVQVDDRAVTAGRRVLGRDRIDRRQAAQRRRPPGERRAGVDHRADVARAEHDRRRLRVLRVPHAGRVHGVGHGRHRRR